MSLADLVPFSSPDAEPERANEILLIFMAVTASY